MNVIQCVGISNKCVRYITEFTDQPPTMKKRLLIYPQYTTGQKIEKFDFI